MKFKVNTFAYYGVMMMNLLIFASWFALIMICPIQSRDDFCTSIIYLLILELLLFTCSPIAHRTVKIDDRFITENKSSITSVGKGERVVKFRNLFGYLLGFAVFVILIPQI